MNACMNEKLNGCVRLFLGHCFQSLATKSLVMLFLSSPKRTPNLDFVYQIAIRSSLFSYYSIKCLVFDQPGITGIATTA